MSFDVNVNGYGRANVFIRPSGNNDNKAQLMAATLDGIVFYTSPVICCCPVEDFDSIQLVAMIALESWHSTDKVGLGTFINQELTKNWPFDAKIP